MNILSNRFQHVLNRYDNPIRKIEEYSRLDLDYAMKSINKEELQFTNFVKSINNNQYKFLKELYIEYKKGKNILDKFVAYDVEVFSSNTKRLISILSYNNMENFNNDRISSILKYQLREEKSTLRIYIEKEEVKGECILKVKLIDLFHLAIPSRHRGVSAEEMKNRLYNQHKGNKQSISQIKNYIKSE